MRLTTLSSVAPRPRKLAIGTFDGVHLGHREVIRDSDTVVTFDPHPVAVLKPEAAPKLLTTVERKAELIADLGVEELVVVNFDKQFAARSAGWFIEEVLIGQLNAAKVSVGTNFHFGKGAQGGVKLLEQYDAFSTRAVELVVVNGKEVSSSQIRRLLLDGEVSAAAELLGAPFQLQGQVIQGDTRGRELGFPTANLVPDPAYAYPANGIYVCLANGMPAAVSVGVRPTFESNGRVLIEAHILDFSADLYGTQLRLDFLQRLRGEIAFDSVEQLTAQMHRDVEEVRAVCGASDTVPSQ